MTEHTEAQLVEKVARETEISIHDVEHVLETATPLIQAQVLRDMRDWFVANEEFLNGLRRYAKEHGIDLTQGEE